MSYLYLASPYSHPDLMVRQERYTEACRAAARLMLAGRIIFSPIAHSHPIERYMPAVQDGEFWQAQDIPLLRHAEGLIVLMLDGWLQSSGIRWEIAEAERLGMPVEYLDPELLP